MNRLLPRPLAALALLGALGTPLAMTAQEAAPGIAIDRPEPPAGPVAPAPALGLAAKLAAAQTYLGVTPEQDEVWRDYAQALIGFVEPLPPPPAAPAQDDALEAERMARFALVRADKARALLDAATALRGALDPVQLQRLKQAEPSFAPPPGPGPDRDPGRGPVHGPGHGPRPPMDPAPQG